MSSLILVVIMCFLYISIFKGLRNIFGIFKTKDSLGEFGEKSAKMYLSHYIKNGAEIISNCYLPLNDGNTTEVDIILLYETGIYVVEVKNYSGWIYGNDQNRYWTKTVARGRYGVDKIQFYNPVKQNITHIKALQCLLNDYETPIYNIVAFSDNSELKDISITNERTIVTNFSRLDNAIAFYEASPVMSRSQIEEYKQILEEYTDVSERVIEEHNSYVQSKKDK